MYVGQAPAYMSDCVKACQALQECISRLYNVTTNSRYHPMQGALYDDIQLEESLVPIMPLHSPPTSWQTKRMSDIAARCQLVKQTSTMGPTPQIGILQERRHTHINMASLTRFRLRCLRFRLGHSASGSLP